MSATQILVNLKTCFPDYVAKCEDVTIVRFGIHFVPFFVCVFCASLWLMLFQKHVAQRRVRKVATIIYLSAAKKSLLYCAGQCLALIWCDLVAAVPQLGGGRGRGVG